MKLVREADRKADVVVVTMHAGAEGSDEQHVRPGPEWFLGEPRGNVVAFSHAVVRAGADLVVGHGPHVLRGIEWYRGRVIAYSLGNFLGNGTLNVSGVSGQTAVLRATLRRDGSWVGREARAGAADCRAACRASTRAARRSRPCASSRGPTSGGTPCASRPPGRCCRPPGAPADACAPTSRPAPSRSSSPTSRARRGCSTSSAPTRTPKRWPSTGARSARPAPPRAVSRWTRRATRSSSPSRRRRAPSRPRRR